MKVTAILAYVLCFYLPWIAQLNAQERGHEPVVPQPPVYSAPQKLKGKVLVLTDKQDDDRISSFRPHSFFGRATKFTIPLGGMIGKSAKNAFGEIYTDGADWMNPPVPAYGYAVIVRPHVSSFSFTYKNTWSAPFPAMQLDVSVSVEDVTGNVIWKHSYQSGEYKGDLVGNDDYENDENMREVTSGQIDELMTRAAHDFAAAPNSIVALRAVASEGQSNSNVDLPNDPLHSATQLALAEVAGESQLHFTQPNYSTFLQTAGKLRATHCSYAKAYSDIYLYWLSKDEGQQVFPVINEGPGTEAYANEVSRMQMAIKLAYWLSHKLGDEVYHNYSAHVVHPALAKWRTNRSRAFSIALEESVLSYYGFYINMDEVSSSFDLVMKDAQLLSMGRLALEEFEFDHDIALLGVKEYFVRTVGVLRGLPTKRAKSYAEIYLYWLSKNHAYQFPAINMTPSTTSYVDQISRMQRMLELSYWLSHEIGDEIYVKYSSYVTQPASTQFKSGKYADFSTALHDNAQRYYRIDINMEQVGSYFDKNEITIPPSTIAH